MTSTITLYKNTKILPEKNLKVDSINLYLATFGESYKKVITNFQYQKSITQLEFDIKIDITQTFLATETLYGYDYASIVNSDNSRPYYYFITNKTWRSESCVMLHLVLDTINTFDSSTDYHISSKTKVIREHKDRFTKLTNNPQTISIHLGSDTKGTLWDTASFSESDDYLHCDFSIAKSIMDALAFAPAFSTATIKITFYYSKNGKKVISSRTFSYPVESLGYFLSNSMYEIEFGRELPQGSGVDKTFTSTNCDIEVTNIYTTFRRKIDLLSEGLTPVLYKKELGKLQEDIETSWNLIYKTAQILSEEESNPVDCYLIPDNDIDVTITASTDQISYGDLGANHFYFLYAPVGAVAGAPHSFSKQYRFKLPNDDEVELSYDFREYGSAGFNAYKCEQKYLHIYADGNDVKCQYRLLTTMYRKQNDNYVATSYSDRLIGEVSGAHLYILNADDGMAFCYYYANAITGATLYENFQINYTFNLTTTSSYLMSIDEYDRTQSTLIKIIKCPYCPSTYAYDLDNNSFVIDSMWIYDSRKLKLNDVNGKFKNTIISNILNPVSQAVILNNVTPNLSQARNSLYESKLYHSDFYQIKFVYDSFTYTIPLERLDLTKTNLREYFAFTFVMTTTMNSKFLFIFEDLVYSHSTEDYDNVLPVARNNEVVIYNSTYLNYLRTAYNYDLKAKERTLRTGAVGLGLSLVGSVSSGALGIASGNPAVAVSSVLSAGSSITTQVMNYVNTIAQQEEAIESKKAILQSESVSVAGSDDLDLLEAYSDNKAKLCLYETSERLKNALFDLFYYTGYTCNEMKIPSFNTRVYFNYVAMELDVSYNDKAITQEILDNIRNRWASGVTIIHQYATGHWLMNYETTKYENWEVSLL